MQHKYYFEVVYRLFVDLWSVTDDLLFGGVPVILGGDFAQILPVVPSGSQADIITASLQWTFIWQHLQRLHLQVNMCVCNSPQAEEFVCWISNLLYNTALHSQISLPLFVS
jgi:hypothetical protein